MSIKNEYQQHNFLSNTGFGTVSPTEKVDVAGNVNVSTGNSYKINGTSVLSGSSLGSGVTGSSLTSVGTLINLTITGDLNVDNSTLFVDSSNNRVGIGTTNPTSALDVSQNDITLRNAATAVGRKITRYLRAYDTGSTTAISQIGFVGTGTNGYQGVITFETKGDGDLFNDTITEKMRINSAGNVGIGTNNPASKLHVYTTTSGGWSVSAGQRIGGYGANAGFMQMGADVSTGRGWIHSFLNGGSGEGSGTYTSLCLNEAGGNVGIGTATPVAKLDIIGSTEALYVDSKNTTGSYIRLHNNGSGSNVGSAIHRFGSAFTVTNAYGPNILNISNWGADMTFLIDSAQNYRFHNDSSEIVRITGGGNVGIGITNPSGALEILGSTTNYFYSNTATSNPATIYARGRGTSSVPLGVTNGDVLGGIYGKGYDSTPALETFNCAAIRMLASETHTTTAAGSKIDFATTANGTFGTGNRITRMTIDNTGYVGIGTISPAQTLHVYTTSNPGSNGAQIHYGDGTYGIFLANGTSTGFSPLIKGVGNDTNDSGLHFIGTLTNDTAANIGILMDARTSSNTAIANAKVLQLNNYTTNLITVNADGSIGIGTTSPIGKFNIFTGLSGNTANVATQATGSIMFANGSTLNTIPVIAGKATSSTGLLIIGANNDASTQPAINFDARENDNTDFTTLTNPAFSFSRFNTDLITILRNGNVGIGTTTPNVPLEVNGAIKSTTSAKVWINFAPAVSPTIRSSYGVSSISRLADGRYQINFSTAFSDSNYVVTGCSQRNGINGDSRITVLGSDGGTYNTPALNMTTTYVNVEVGFSTVSAGTDIYMGSIAIFSS